MTGCAFAAEISEDRRRCAIAAAWRPPPGRVTVEIAWYGPPWQAVEHMAGLYERREPVVVVVDGRAQSATLIKPLAMAGVPTFQPSTQDVAVAHGEFMDLVSLGELAHLNQAELTEAVRGAATRPLAGARAWERKVDTADQSPLVAATLAVWAFGKWETAGEPQAWVI